MSVKTFQFPSTQTIVSTAASVAASAMLFRSLAREYLPRDLQYYIYFKLRKLFALFSSEFVLVVDEFEGLGNNHLFQALEVYLRPQIHPNTRSFRVTMPKKENKISVVMERNQEIIEKFNGVELRWKLVSKNIPSKYIQAPRSEYYPSIEKSELRYYELRFNMKYKNMVLSEYLPYVMEQAKELKEEKKTLKLFTLKRERVRYIGRRPEMWQSVNLDHPATFDTLAMDLEAKQGIMEDLDRFLQRKDFYRKVGKAWKRGYLLFGPPGTGKSSLIGAMANYLNFDIYDLELTDIRRNSELRKLLISTGNRSILVVEDIDCSLDLQDRLKKAKKPKVPGYSYEDQEPKVTLSAVLNFIDGLWSSCGDERIIVFTTNHRDRLDPALLRPGRMDVHIHMSYCSPCGFRTLASNYLGITEHPLFVEVERLMKTTNVTPAEVGEELLKNEDSELALTSLLDLLRQKAGQSHEPELLTPI
ncbi:AAA-ATPase At3g50940-like [Neltuma alba]|uniref:AAA-ATPase At3g50940-like n=1 Tax=Neltuma alba TaxID=207710 RepID=UPI0010A36765|nr:AAA-ATPase At3g50940-like [Prosopis alba]